VSDPVHIGPLLAQVLAEAAKKQRENAKRAKQERLE